MGFESLETRRVFAECSGFSDLGEHFDEVFGEIVEAVNDEWKLEDVPLIGNRLATMDSPVDDVAGAFGSAMETLGNLEADVTEQDVANAIQDALGAVGIQGTSLNVTCEGDNITIDVELSRELALVDETASFDIGLGSLPIFSVQGEQNIELGVGLQGLDFTLALVNGDPSFTWGDGQFELEMYADFSGSGFGAIVGLLAGDVTIEDRGAYDHPIEVSLAYDRSGGSLLTLDADAHFNVEFESGVNPELIAGLPNVSATIGVDWFGPNAADPLPQVSYEGVKIGFGGVVSSVLQPILEHVGPIVDKIGVVNDLLNAPIPVLDDLIDPDPTVLSILGLASEFAPPDYQAVVRFLEASSLIVDIVDMFDTDGEDVVLDLGGFNLLGNGDLRELSDVSLSQLATPTFEGLPFNPLGEGLDIGGIQEALAEHVSPEIAAAVGELASRFEDPVQLNIPFLTDPTGSVFSLLMGHDVDFFRVDVAYQGSAGFKPDVSVPGFSFSFGNTLDYDVEAGLGLDTRGIRNFIQSVADGSPTASHFGEGFYITEGTHVRLEAGLSAELSANLVFVHGGIDGGIEGFLEVRPEPSDEWEDPSPYEDDKLYIRTDLGPCLGHAEGGISGHLDAWIGIGAKVPFTDIFVGGKKEFHLAHKDFFSFGTECIPNEFVFAPEEFEPATHYLDQTEADLDAIQAGELWLNIGDRSHLRGFLDSQENETILVEHVETVGGLETVAVTFAGKSETYTGVERIVAHGGEGEDHITIAEGVLSDVYISGGNGPDRIISHTAGESELHGDDLFMAVTNELGDSDDYIEGGFGPNTLEGGIGNDQLVGGTAVNTIIGGGDDDLIMGGPEIDTLYGDFPGSILAGGADLIVGGGGSDTIFGGGGDDRLVGASDSVGNPADFPGQNTIHGDGGNDTIVAGFFGDTIFGGLHDDDIYPGPGDDVIATYAQGAPLDQAARNRVHWEAGDGNTLILNSIYSIDSVSLFGTSGPDTFGVADGVTQTLGEFEFEIGVEAPGGKLVSMTNVSRLNVDGLDGADTTWLHAITDNPESSKPLKHISVNLAEDHRDDGDVDQIYVLGTDADDELTVDTKQLQFGGPDYYDDTGGEYRWGGVTSINGFARYEILATNVEDDLQIYTFDGQDEITVNGITGPTMVDTGNHDDQLTVNASTLGQPTFPWEEPIEADFLAELELEAGNGSNELSVFESHSDIPDTIDVYDDAISSKLLPLVSFQATGGTFSKLEVAGGEFNDVIRVRSTHPNVNTTIVGGFHQPGYVGVAEGDQIVISSDGTTAGGLQDIRSSLVVAGHNDATTQVHISDRAAASGNSNVSVTGSLVTGFAGPADAMQIGTSVGLLELHLYGSDDAAVAESFVLDSPQHPVFVHGGAGEEEVTALSLVYPATVQGGDGNDHVDVPDLGSILAPFYVNGDGGVDIVDVDDAAAPSGSTYLLHPMHLQRGGRMVMFDATTDDMNVSTSQGNDDVYVVGMPTATTVRFDQGDGANAIHGPNQSNVWEINAAGSGVLNSRVVFLGTRALMGSGGDDHFIVGDGASISDGVDGGWGTGTDTLDYSPAKSPVDVQLTGPTGDGTGPGVNTFVGMESLVGGQSTDDVLRGFDGNVDWEITGPDEAVLGGDSTPILVVAVENFMGGAGTDCFVVHEAGSLSGMAHGGGGDDVLDYSPSVSDIVVDLRTGQASRFGSARSFLDVIGGAGDDMLFGNFEDNFLDGRAGNDVLIGQNGNDTLLGRSGRDLLIGGKGQDDLSGQDGEDILIGGMTDHDNDVVALSLLRNEWTRNDLTYKERVHHLANGGGLNGATVLDDSTVTHDNAVDELFGNADQDWFWSDAADGLDALANELVNS